MIVRASLAPWLVTLVLSGMLTGLMAPAVAAQVPFKVLATYPSAEAMDVSAAAMVRVEFSRAVDVDSVKGAMRILGDWSGVAPGEARVAATGDALNFRPLRPFYPGELVTVMLSDSILGDTGGQLRGGYAFQFRILPAPGNISFSLDKIISTVLPGEGHVQPYGSYAGDLDGDGSPDLSLPHELGNDLRVFLNDGCGDFGELTIYDMPAGSKPSANIGGDFNGDGLLDLVTGNIEGDSISVFMGDGVGGFLDPVTYPVGDTPRGVAALDTEGDGDLDLVVANRGSSNLCQLLNLGDGTFGPASFFEGGGDNETSVVAADADGDGMMDLFVTSYGSSTVSVLLGTVTGDFVLVDTSDVGVLPWNGTVGDVDGDGDPDIMTVNSGSANVTLVLNEGGGMLGPPINLPVGGFPISIDLGDLDGDGDLDLVASNFGGGGDWTVYTNDGAGNFGSAFELDAQTSGSCAVLLDYDRNGRLDIIGIDEAADQLRFWRQEAPALGGVQFESCVAALRINNRGHRAGFGGQAPHELVLGEAFFLGVTGPPGAAYIMVVGSPLAPGQLSLWGVVNFDPTQNVGLRLPGQMNGFGEDIQRLVVSANFPSGIEIVLQAIVSNPGSLRLSNPEIVRLVD